jgi:hypothetical protein
LHRCGLIHNFERKNPNLSGITVYIRLFFPIRFIGKFDLSPENIATGFKYLEKINIDRTGLGFSQGFILGIINALITFQSHTGKMNHIIDPPAFINRAGMIQNDNERIGSQRTSHPAMGAAFEYFGQLAVVENFPGIKPMRKAQFQPSLKTHFSDEK